MAKQREAVDRSAPWYRSWPETVPVGRAHVVDSLPRLVMRDCQYDTLAEYQPWPSHEPGWFMLEWDVALDAPSRQRFAEGALATPDRISVAPYTLVKPKFKDVPVWVHRGRSSRWVTEGDPVCHQFGLGCIYWPQALLDDFLATKPDPWRDTQFSLWHRAHHPPVRIDWSVRPQHLHGD